MKAFESLYESIKTGGVGLTITASGSRSLCFRMPSIEDYNNCVLYSQNPTEQNYYLMASSLTSSGGIAIPENLLLDKIDFMESLSVQLFRRMCVGFSRFISRGLDSEKFMEAFCFTALSRNLWFSWKHSHQLGFPLKNQDRPLTQLQINWIAYNVAEDERIRINHEWSRSFFVASSMNPKGVEKVRQRWEENETKEQEHRQKVIEAAKKGEVVRGRAEDNEKSFEDLRREYRNWVDGVEDEHDRMVAQYKEWVETKIQQQKQVDRLQAHNLSKQDMLTALNSSMGSPVRAVSDEEVARLAAMRAKKQGFVNEREEYDNHIKTLLNPKFEQPNETLMDKISNRRQTIEEV